MISRVSIVGVVVIVSGMIGWTLLNEGFQCKTVFSINHFSNI